MSTRHYTINQFFRQMPNELLARYFYCCSEFKGFDFKSAEDINPHDLLRQWSSLPEDVRTEHEITFREIHSLSCEKGFYAILDELKWQLRAEITRAEEIQEQLSKLPNHFHRAMVTYLDHTFCWRGASRFYRADSLSSWRKRKHLGHKPARVEQQHLDEFNRMLCEYLQSAQGRGRNSIVEPFRRGDRDYFFAYPEDHSVQEVEWEKGKLIRRPHNPAFEIIFVYSQAEGSLDIYYRGPRKPVQSFQEIFAYSILGLDELPPDPANEKVYDLNPLGDRGYHFVFNPDNDIKHASIQKIRFSSRTRKGERILVETGNPDNSLAIYDTIERMVKTGQLRHCNVTQIEVVADIGESGTDKTKRKRFRVTHPNSCTLKYDKAGILLRNMLEESGIEPKDREETTRQEPLPLSKNSPKVQ